MRSAHNFIKGKTGVYKYINNSFLSILALILATSQCGLSALANEPNFNPSMSANSASHSHNEAPNVVADAAHALASINPSIVNPNVEIGSILSNIVHSSLNLNSILHDVNSGSLNHATSIAIGDHALTVNANQFLTPAEAIALNQVLTSNHQSLVLDSLGQAVGGSFSVSNLVSNSASLLISHGVTLYDNSNDLTLSGNLVNFGDIVVNGTGNLAASNIINANAAMISSSGVLGLTTHDLINEGAIYGANGLNINASTIFNAGTIEAQLGNINVASLNTLDVTGTNNSLFEASNGNITISTSANMNLVGSNYLSQALDLNASLGSIEGAIGNVSGVININANSVHLATTSNDMLLGNDKVNGDPTYVNTSGDISINGEVTTNGNNLAVIAFGNINIATGSTGFINTSSTAGSSGNVVMIAGLGSNITYTGSNTTNGIPTPGTAIGITETVTVSLGATSSNSGGNIDLVTNNGLTTSSPVINTASQFTNGNGGSVTLLAVSNGSIGGEVITGSANTNYGILTGGNGTGNNGDVTVIGTATSGTGVSLGYITTTGGSGTGGDVSIYTAQPNSASLTFDSTGAFTGGTITPNLASIEPASVVLNGNIITSTNSNTITIEAGTTVASSSNLLTGNSLVLTSGSGDFGSFSQNAQLNVGNLTLNVTGNAYLTDYASSVNVNNSSVGATNTFELTMNNSVSGSINVTGLLQAGPDNGTGNVILTASGSGTIETPSSVDIVQAGSVTLNTAGGNIGNNTGNYMQVDTTYLSVNTLNNGSNLGSAMLTNANMAVSYLNASSVGNNGELFLSTSAGLIINGLISAGGIGGSTSGMIILDVFGGTITTQAASDILVAGSQISFQTNGYNIGSASQSILTSTGHIYINTLNSGATTGSAYVNNVSNNTVYIDAASVAANGTLQVTSNGDMVINGNLTAGTDSGLGTINLIATGSATITTNSPSDTLTAGLVNLTTNGSDIGSLSQGFQIDANSVSVTTGGINGSAYIQDISTNNVTIVNAIVGSNSSDTFGLSAVNNSTGYIYTATGITVEAPNVIIASVNGNIGSSNQLFSINATSVTLNATSNSVYATDSASGNIVFNTITAQGNSVANASAMTGGGTYQFTANGNLETSSGSNISGDNVVLTSALGSVGNSSNVLALNANNLTISAATDSYSNNSAASTVLNASTVGSNNTFSLVESGGSISINGNISAGADTGSGVINLNAAGPITNAASSNTLTAGSVNLTTSGFSIGSTSQPVIVDANSLGITTGGSAGTSAYIQDISTNNVVLTQALAGSSSTDTFALSVNNSSSTSLNTGLGVSVTAGNVLLISANGSIGGSGTNDAISLNSNSVTLNALSGSVYANDSASGNINFANSTFLSNPITNSASLTSTGTYSFDANNTNTAGNLVTTNSVSGGNLILNSTLGSIGSNSSAFNVDSNNLTVNAAYNVYLNDTAATATIVGASSAGSADTFSLVSSGNIVISATISAGSDSGSGIVALATTSSTGTITTSANTDIVTAGNISLTSSGNDIGSLSQGVLIDSNNVSVTTGGATGNAYVQDISAGNIVISQGIVGTVSSDTFGFSGVNSSITSITTANGVTILAPNVIIASVNGNVGTANDYLSISSSAVTLNATSNSVFANDSIAGNITFSTVSAQGQTVANAADTNGGGTYSFNANNSTKAGNLLTATSSNITAKYVELSSSLGSIGTNTNSLSVNAANLSLNSGSDSYVVDSATNVNLMASSSGVTNTLSVTTPGNLVIDGVITAGGISGTGSIVLATTGTSTTISQASTSDTVTAGSITFTTAGGFITTQAAIAGNTVNFTTAGPGGITLNSKVGAITGTTTLTANGTGYITTGKYGLAIGNNLSLTSTNGEIGYGVGGTQPFTTQANNLTFNAGLSVGILNATNSLNVGTSTSQANVYVENSGNITGSGTITGPVVGLYSFNGSSGIGTASNIIQVSAHNIGFESFGLGSSVYVNDKYTGPTDLQASQASSNPGSAGNGGIFKLDTAGPLTIYAQVDQNGVVTPGNVAGAIIAIQALSGYGIYNDANMQASNFIFLTASGNGYIAEPATNALMIAPNVSLVSGGGAIGAGGRLLVNSANVSASTIGLNNFVNIYDEATNSGIVGGQAGSYFTFNTNGNVNIYGNIATGAGSNANGGAINISANGLVHLGTTKAISILANSGPIVFQENNTTTGSISLFKGDTVATNAPIGTAAYVVFNFGNYTQVNTSNPSPNNITVNNTGGASVYFGTNGISAAANGNVLNAKGQDIVFNTGALLSNAITLGGNVTITADPPVISLSNNINPSLVQNNLSSLNASNQVGNISYQSFTSNLSANILDNNQATINTINQANGLKNSNTSVVDFNSDNSDVVSKSSLYMPIAYTSSVVKGATICPSNKLPSSLNDTSALINANHDMTVSLGNGKVKLALKRGAFVLAISHGHCVSVYNLHDKAVNSVVISFNSTGKINLAPGQHATVSDLRTNCDFADLNQAKHIAYRGLTGKFINGNLVYVSDFSISSAISSIQPLKAIFRSNDKQLKNLSNQILKTMVVVTQTTSYKGVYELVQTPKLTAMK